MISLADKLQIMVFFAGMIAAACALAMFSTPRRGYMRVMEKTAAGAVLCLICSLLLKPFGIPVAQSPLSAAAAGFWGLPGVVLSTFVSLVITVQ